MVRAIPLFAVIVMACDSPSEPEAQVTVELTRFNAPGQLQAFELTIMNVAAIGRPASRGGARLAVVQPDTNHCLSNWINGKGGGCWLPLDVMNIPAAGLRIAGGNVKSGSYDLGIYPSCDATLILRDSLRAGAVFLPPGRHVAHTGCGEGDVRVTPFQVRDSDPVKVAAQLDVGATLETLDNLSGSLRISLVFRAAPH